MGNISRFELNGVWYKTAPKTSSYIGCAFRNNHLSCMSAPPCSASSEKNRLAVIFIKNIRINEEHIQTISNEKSANSITDTDSCSNSTSSQIIELEKITKMLENDFNKIKKHDLYYATALILAALNSPCFAMITFTLGFGYFFIERLNLKRN